MPRQVGSTEKAFLNAKNTRWELESQKCLSVGGTDSGSPFIKHSQIYCYILKDTREERESPGLGVKGYADHS